MEELFQALSNLSPYGLTALISIVVAVGGYREKLRRAAKKEAMESLKWRGYQPGNGDPPPKDRRHGNARPCPMGGSDVMERLVREIRIMTATVGESYLLQRVQAQRPGAVVALEAFRTPEKIRQEHGG